MNKIKESAPEAVPRDVSLGCPAPPHPAGVSPVLRRWAHAMGCCQHLSKHYTALPVIKCLGGEGMSKLAALREEFADRFDLPAESAGVVKVTLTGSRRALIEDHRTLESYTRECVEVAAGAHHVRITGEALELKAMDREALLVTGRILSVELG